MRVTSTGKDTVFGKMMSQTDADSSGKKCKLEACLHKVTTCTHFSGLLISIVIIVALFIRYEFGKLDEKNGSYMPESMEEQTRIKTIMDAIKGIIAGLGGRARVLTTLLSVSLLGIVEGMPVVISVAIFIWNRKTLAHKASERDYLAPGNMASVTTIISGKFGGLTEHEMEVDNFLVGEEFVSQSSTVDSNVLEGLCDGIGTFFMRSNGCESKVGALISWAEAKLGMKEGSVREQCEIISGQGSDPFQECCQVLLEKSDNEGRMKYLHCCGPPPDVLRLSSHYYDIKGEIQELDVQIDQAIERMLAEESEVIAFARKYVDESDAASVEANCLIFMGMIGLKNTKREDIIEAVSILKQGGVTTILASGDDISALETIGQDCGLLTRGSDDQVFTGEQFRAWTNEEKTEKLEKIHIMGNCLPSDKILLIKSLKEKDEVVALVGQDTTDSPALKQADIGITSGTWSSEVAVGNRDINIWNGDFCFLVNLIKNGRCFQENIQKFIQLELIVTISSSLINFTTTVFLGDAPITAVQLSWLNLVVSFVGGLALLTGPSTKPLMTMEPVKSCAKLITKAMWRNIVIQAAYQTAIFVTLQNKGHAILGINGGRVKSVIYNSFFLCQIFNMFIAREPERRNIFSGLVRKNWWFWVALVLFLMCQAVFAAAERVVGSSPGLSWKLWAVCLLIAVVSWLLDWAGKTASNLAARWILDQGGKSKSNSISHTPTCC
ncbi:tRNA methyltransferase [Handroanthus impetiginosus]|uniref:tRNA methyltransferase n=1 Tax=Handroanthus impetiginosus TaxID=429701 RepID=A0A2G9GBP1_9LAMI|nr:tRNA methyltransferase [Handroanthus impetiginosus]